MYTQWGKAAAQGSNGKNCVLQIIFESWISCTVLTLGCSSRGEGPAPAPGQVDSTAGWVRGKRGLLQLLGACLWSKRYCSCHTRLPCGRWGKPQSGTRRTLLWSRWGVQAWQSVRLHPRSPSVLATSIVKSPDDGLFLPVGLAQSGHVSGSNLQVLYCINICISNEKWWGRGSDAVEMGSSKKIWDRLVMQIFLPSGNSFWRREQRIKQKYESSTQLGERKAPGKWLPAEKMFRLRKEETNVQSWGQQCKVFRSVFYMTELGIQRNPERKYHPLYSLENAMSVLPQMATALAGSRGMNSSICTRSGALWSPR